MWTLVLWTLWLVLAVLLFVQIRIATSDEIMIPESVLRNVEGRLAEQGLRVSFGSIQCDTRGHVVVRDLKLFAQTHDDPLVIARSVWFEINPYALFVHKISPRKARIEGASFRLPAMLSSDGENSAVIDDVDAEIEFHSPELQINSLRARMANLTLLCRGGLALPKTTARIHAAQTPGEFVTSILAAYQKTARQIAEMVPQLESFEQPALDITLTPDPGHVANAKLSFTANSLFIDAPENTPQGGPVSQPAATAASTFSVPAAKPAGVPAPVISRLRPPLMAFGPLIATTAFDLSELGSAPSGADSSGDEPALRPPLRIRIFTTEAILPAAMHARNAHLFLVVPLSQILQYAEGTADSSKTSTPAAKTKPTQLNFALTAALDAFSAHGITAHALTARINGKLPTDINLTANASVLGKPLLIDTEADLDAKTADVRAATDVTPAHIAVLSRELHYDVGAIIKPARPIGIDVATRLEPGWKFSGATGDLDIGKLYAYGVNVDRARGAFAYDHASTSIVFSPAVAVVGDSIARGSYSMNFKTLDFRFLLRGELRPMAIKGWFGVWWPNFWKAFSFTEPVPHGDVEVTGNWRHTHLVHVFVFADANKAAFNTVKFDSVLLTLFARPDYFDVLELVATRESGYARGSFTHQTKEPGNLHVQTTLDFTAHHVNPVAIAPALGTTLVKGLEPIKFETPPEELKVWGRVDGPASPRGRHTTLDIEMRTPGIITYDGVALADSTLQLRARDDIINLDKMDAQFAGGRLGIKAQVSGQDAGRKLGFDLTLDQTNLGRTIAELETFAAHRRGETPPSQSKYQQKLATGLLDLRVSLDGNYSDALSYKGNGSAEVSGAELVNINIFGSLSKALSSVKLLDFTSLNLHSGQVNFTIDHKKLLITQGNLMGRKARVIFSGDYEIDNKRAQFTAKIYPLAESKGVLGQGFGLLLVPITHLMEFKLDGPIDAPSWRFSYGPTSFIRALSGKSTGGEVEKVEEVPLPLLMPLPADDKTPTTLRRQ